LQEIVPKIAEAN
jgi:hypothetical protein